VSKNVRKILRHALYAGLREGSVAVPQLLLKHYRHLNLSETEVMVLIHLISFVEKEGKEFPTIEEIEQRMSASPETVIACLQKLLKEDFIRIEEEVDPVTGIQSERYCLAPLYQRLALRAAEELERKWQHAGTFAENRDDIYTAFEQEFGRPLTPMELETVTSWLEQDRYPEELIRAALKEAVFSGKLHFRYIDRILLDWSRNRIANAEQAKEYARQFRGLR